MKRRNEFLICKRDGRREHVRASKLARSIDRALDGAAPTPWFALDAATGLLAGLRERADSGAPCSTRQLAADVIAWLQAGGLAAAARRYADQGVRARRRATLLAARSPAVVTAGAARFTAAGHGVPTDPRLN